MTDPMQAIDAAVASVTDPSDSAQIAAALRSVSPALVDDVIFGVASSTVGSTADGVLLGVGLAASPGVGVGQIATDPVAALDAWERGTEVVLLVDETRPEDEPAMRVASAIVCRRGGVASHAAIIARQWGVPAVCGIGELDVAEGDRVLVDGATGEVRRLDDVTIPTERAAAEPHRPLEEMPAGLVTLLEWADAVVGPKVSIMANADQAADVVLALALGARGVGLCRTEHQFLGDDTGIISRSLTGEAGALDELTSLQRSTLAALLREVGQAPVTVRLLDAPVHEFGAAHVEHNPMLGVRGVRLSVSRPDLLVAQAEGIAHAIADNVLATDGSDTRPDVRVLVPMVALADEMKWARSVLSDTFFRVGIERGVDLDVPIGTMIETPRAALIGSALATHSDFFAFGTNDLTQLTYGFSRDDLDHQLMPEYRRIGFVARSPFETLDGSGVVRLMALATETGRAQRPDLGLSMCGEHGGDPASISIAIQLGLHEISVSPYRVPATRLAGAHAVLGPAAPDGPGSAG
jgi:pyruvate,orthophosphate dikinase